MTPELSTLTTTQSWLTTAERLLFRQLNRAAGLLLLMLRLARPVSPRQAADLLDLSPKTAGVYFRTLQELGMVHPEASGKRYRLDDFFTSAGSRSDEAKPPGWVNFTGLTPELGKFFHYAPVNTIKDSDIRSLKDSVILTAPDEEKFLPISADQQPPLCDHPPEELLDALRQAGICEPKRSSLARKAGMTVNRIRLWEAQLQHSQGRQYRVGLLIHILESDLPDPPSRSNGHLLTCECRDCQRLKYDVCLDCFENPCKCGRK